MFTSLALFRWGVSSTSRLIQVRENEVVPIVTITDFMRPYVSNDFERAYTVVSDWKK